MGAQMQFEYNCKDWNQNSELKLIQVKIYDCPLYLNPILSVPQIG
jgi:hypothetical protein